MAWKKVEHYSLGYRLDDKQFLFYYTLAGEKLLHQFFPTPGEFLALADMFRNDGPISFNTTGRYFVTASELVGEEETP
jgi:hypothetical protein